MRDWRRGQRDDFSLREIGHVLWERRRLVACVVAVLALFMLLYDLLREPMYTARAVVAVEPRERIDESGEREAFLGEVIGVVATDELLSSAMERAGWRSGLDDFRSRLDADPFVTNEGGTGLNVRFSGPGREEAARAANAYAELFVERVDELGETRLAGASLAADADVEHRAVSSEAVSNHRPLLYMLAAMAAGAVLGGGGALLLESRARSWRDAHDAEVTLRAPVLGVIPDYSVLEEKERSP